MLYSSESEGASWKTSLSYCSDWTSTSSSPSSSPKNSSPSSPSLISKSSTSLPCGSSSISASSSSLAFFLDLASSSFCRFCFSLLLFSRRCLYKNSSSGRMSAFSWVMVVYIQINFNILQILTFCFSLLPRSLLFLLVAQRSS